MKKFIVTFLEVLLTIVALASLFLMYLTFNEYTPAEKETVEVQGSSSAKVETNKDLSILTWNIGYSALGENQDFAMDGGHLPPATREQVNIYLDGILNTVKQQNADFNIIQELDLYSTRSFYVDMSSLLTKANSTFAYNYKCKFVPFPIPPLATINSGIFTTTNYTIESALRRSVPCPFSWPLCTANLKRCILISYLPIEGSNKKLVIINLHLEAYSDSKARIVQFGILNQIMEEEYAKGNYVIAGGDFNQTFPGTLAQYPNTHVENWDPNELTKDMLNSKFSFNYDPSSPTCRLLNQPYDPSDTVGTQYYVIDGFLTTPNVLVKSVTTLDMDFENSDHNPVKMVFQLVK